MKFSRICFAAVAAALVFVSASALRADTPGFYTLDGLLTKSTHTIDPVGAAGAVPLNPSGVPYGEFAWGVGGVTEGFTLSTATQLWLLNFKGVGRTVFSVR